MHNSSLYSSDREIVLTNPHICPIWQSKKINTEAVNDYPPIRFEIRFERKFPTVGLYFLTLPVETCEICAPWKSYLECELRVCVSFTDALVMVIGLLFSSLLLSRHTA